VPFAVTADEGDALEFVWGAGPVRRPTSYHVSLAEKWNSIPPRSVYVFRICGTQVDAC
jgi:hypothetical protein